MAAGFQVFNDAGFIQIDSDYSNYILTAKGTSTSTPNSGSGYNLVEVSSGKKNSIIAVRSSSHIVVFNKLDSNGNVLHQIYTVTGQATVDWWVFAADAPGPASFGMEIYNESGKRVFQTVEKYLRLIAFKSVTATTGMTGSISTPGKNPAWVSASYCAILEGVTVAVPGGTPQSQGNLSTLTGRTVSGGIEYKTTGIYDFGSNRGTSDNRNAAFMVVDVTNM